MGGWGVPGVKGGAGNAGTNVVGAGAAGEGSGGRPKKIIMECHDASSLLITHQKGEM